MNPTPLTFTFIIPVKNDAAGLRRCLQSIADSKLPADVSEVVVSDNGSSDDSVAVGRDAGASVLRLPGLNVAELRNRGAEASQGRFLAFVDADHEIAEDWQMVALELLSMDGVGAVGSLCTAPNEPTWVQRMYDTFRDRGTATREVRWLGSGNLAVSREAFVRVGGFDSSLEACEDVDLCRRLLAAGYRLLADPRLESVHYGDPASLGALFRSELWRGRHNLRVSLRGPMSIADMPSVLIPLVDLACVGVFLGGLAMFSHTGLALAASAALVFGAFSAARASVMLSRLAGRRFLDPIRACSVACVYDLARALALVIQVRHRRAESTMATEAAQS